jgi:hypothetical protein
MKTNRNHYKPAAPADLPLDKPTVFTLLSRIAGSAVSGGMLLFMALCGAVIVFLDYNKLPAGHLPELMFITVLVVAMLRGIRAWQEDLDEFRRDLTEYRMNLAELRSKQQVRKDIVWDRR